MNLDGKITCAQSSAIKSRAYLEYRKDMKKKAIAELEILPWLEDKLKQLYPDKNIKVYKSGGDQFLWFLRKGGISREPDFKAQIGDSEIEIEFQYGGGDIREDYIFDFKTSKVGKKLKGQNNRIPKNTIFFYLFKEFPSKFAFMPAEWILRNGIEGVAPAWGNREVYKITGKQLLTKTDDDESLKTIWDSITVKFFILEFQHELINISKENLSHLLQKVIDENQIVKIIPKDLDSFFKICFMLDNLNKFPQNANIWLIYLLSYINSNLRLDDLAKIVYCINFLYLKIELMSNEIAQLILNIKNILEIIKTYRHDDGSYRSSLSISPLEETRYALFSINLLEDITQDIIFYYNAPQLKPITKFYENVEDIKKTYLLLKNI
jgi:hypothetical protein